MEHLMHYFAMLFDLKLILTMAFLAVSMRWVERTWITRWCINAASTLSFRTNDDVLVFGRFTSFKKLSDAVKPQSLLKSIYSVSIGMFDKKEDFYIDQIDAIVFCSMSVPVAEFSFIVKQKGVVWYDY